MPVLTRRQCKQLKLTNPEMIIFYSYEKKKNKKQITKNIEINHLLKVFKLISGCLRENTNNIKNVIHNHFVCNELQCYSLVGRNKLNQNKNIQLKHNNVDCLKIKQNLCLNLIFDYNFALEIIKLFIHLQILNNGYHLIFELNFINYFLKLLLMFYIFMVYRTIVLH